MIDDNIRKQIGISVNDFCTLLNIHRGTYHKWVTGERKPDKAAVRLLEIINWLHQKDLLKEFIADINSVG